MPELVDRAYIQRANALLSATRNATRIVGPSVAGLIVVGAGGGWAVAVDAASYLVAALCLARLRLPAPVRAAGASMLRDLREGWGVFRSLTWVWAGSLAFAGINFVQAGVWGVLGPVIAQDTIGAGAWGFVLSSVAAGFLVSSIVMYRLTFTHLLLAGQVCAVLGAVPLLLLGVGVPVPVLVVGAFLSGAGTGVYGIAYETSMQEHIPGESLSRVVSIDTVGSMVTVPLGQLAVIPVAAAFGDAQVAVAGGSSTPWLRWPSSPSVRCGSCGTGRRRRTRWDAERVTEPRPPLPEEEGGDPACWARRVCPACGRLADEDPPTRCPACGADLPDE